MFGKFQCMSAFFSDFVVVASFFRWCIKKQNKGLRIHFVDKNLYHFLKNLLFIQVVSKNKTFQDQITHIIIISEIDKSILNTELNIAQVRNHIYRCVFSIIHYQFSFPAIVCLPSGPHLAAQRVCNDVEVLVR